MRVAVAVHVHPETATATALSYLAYAAPRLLLTCTMMTCRANMTVHACVLTIVSCAPCLDAPFGGTVMRTLQMQRHGCHKSSNDEMHDAFNKTRAPTACFQADRQ